MPINAIKFLVKIQDLRREFTMQELEKAVLNCINYIENKKGKYANFPITIRAALRGNSTNKEYFNNFDYFGFYPNLSNEDLVIALNKLLKDGHIEEDKDYVSVNNKTKFKCKLEKNSKISQFKDLIVDENNINKYLNSIPTVKERATYLLNFTRNNKDKKLNLTKVNLQGGDLRGINLKGADLSYANLQNTKFSRLKVEYVERSRIKRVGNKSFLSKGYNIWRESGLSEANLYKADLRGANLSHAYLVGANFTNSDLRGANLSNANLMDGVLSGAKLKESNFKNTHLYKVDLLNVDLRETNILEAGNKDIPIEKYDEVGLNEAFKKYESSIYIAEKIRKYALIFPDRPIDLHGLDLRGADLSGVNLSGANLEGTNLGPLTTYRYAKGGDYIGFYKGASYYTKGQVVSDSKNSILNGANLSNANFKNSRIVHVDMRYANLKGADFRGSSLKKSNISYSLVDNANFTGVDFSDIRFVGVNLKTAIGAKVNFSDKILNLV